MVCAVCGVCCVWRWWCVWWFGGLWWCVVVVCVVVCVMVRVVVFVVVLFVVVCGVCHGGVCGWVLKSGGKFTAAVGGTAGAGLEAHPGAAGRRVEGRNRQGIGPVSQPIWPANNKRLL